MPLNASDELLRIYITLVFSLFSILLINLFIHFKIDLYIYYFSLCISLLFISQNLFILYFLLLHSVMYFRFIMQMRGTVILSVSWGKYFADILQICRFAFPTFMLMFGVL